jgi:hypothetical protein
MVATGIGNVCGAGGLVVGKATETSNLSVNSSNFVVTSRDCSVMMIGSLLVTNNLYVSDGTTCSQDANREVVDSDGGISLLGAMHGVGELSVSGDKFIVSTVLGDMSGAGSWMVGKMAGSLDVRGRDTVMTKSDGTSLRDKCT